MGGEAISLGTVIGIAAALIGGEIVSDQAVDDEINGNGLFGQAMQNIAGLFGKNSVHSESGDGESASGEPSGSGGSNGNNPDPDDDDNEDKPKTSFGAKILGQLSKRGWTVESVQELISNPSRTAETADTRNNPDGSINNDPATAYIDEDGSYVVQNDETGDIVQVSDRSNSGWLSPF